MADQLDKSLSGDIYQFYELAGGPVQINDLVVVENRGESRAALDAGCLIRIMSEEGIGRPSTDARYVENI